MRAYNEQFGGSGEYWGFPLLSQEMDELIMACVLSRGPSGEQRSIDVGMEEVVVKGLNAVVDRASHLKNLDGPVSLQSLREQDTSDLPAFYGAGTVKVGMVFLDDDHLGALDRLAIITGGTPRSDVLRMAALEGVKIAMSDPDIGKKRQSLNVTREQNAEALRARVVGAIFMEENY